MFKRFFSLAMVAVIVSSQLGTTVQAVATLDTTFYSGNDINFYDPTCPDPAAQSVGAVQIAGKDNTEKILNFFMRKGLSLAQAAGFIGNMQQESGLNPAIRQGGRIVGDDYVLENGVGFGLVQWTFDSRQKPLQDHIKSMGVGITDMGGQLEFVWKELNTGYKGTLESLRSATNPVDAAIIVHDTYEISADSAAAVRSVRGGTAQKVYDQYSDAPALAGGTAEMAMNDPAGDTDSAELVGNMKPKQPSQADGCSTGTFAGGDLNATLMAYAWDTNKGNDINAKPEYTAAITTAQAEGRYVGGIKYKGIDCGGFVTTLLYDSGFDKGYNENAKGGATYAQELWLKENWEPISATDAADRVPGDVAINNQHTYVYVGDVPGFNSKIASSSLDERSPMAGGEAITDSSFNWYRKKGTPNVSKENINV